MTPFIKESKKSPHMLGKRAKSNSHHIAVNFEYHIPDMLKTELDRVKALVINFFLHLRCLTIIRMYLEGKEVAK